MEISKKLKETRETLKSDRKSKCLLPQEVIYSKIIIDIQEKEHLYPSRQVAHEFAVLLKKRISKEDDIKQEQLSHK